MARRWFCVWEVHTLDGKSFLINNDTDKSGMRTVLNDKNSELPHALEDSEG